MQPKRVRGDDDLISSKCCHYRGKTTFSWSKQRKETCLGDTHGEETCMLKIIQISDILWDEYYSNKNIYCGVWVGEPTTN